MPEENRRRQSHRGVDSLLLGNTDMVFSSNESSHRQSISSSSVRQSGTTASDRGTTSSSEENATNGMQAIRTSLQQRNIFSQATKIIMQSWADTSLKQYQPYLKTWLKLCREWKINPYDPPLTKVLDFLTSLCERGLKYDTINTAKSAVSAITEPKNGLTLGNQPLILQFMKGVFRSKPPTPRYESTWDVQIVLSQLSSFAPPNELDLKSLTLKLVMFVALVSAQRAQNIHLLDLQFMKVSGDSVEFVFPTHIKQSRSGYKVPSVILNAYPSDSRLCVVTHLNIYREKTRSLRGVETKLFICYIKPYRGVSKDTIARWIRTVMMNAGLDVKIFKPHSTRSATTSKATQTCVPIENILKHAGLSNHRTFDRFYNKPVRDCRLCS